MMEFFNRHKRGFITGVVVICLLLIIITATGFFRPKLLEDAVGFVVVPVQSAFVSIGKLVSDKVDAVVSITDLQAENERLKAENEQLLYQNSRLRAVEAENERLSKLLNTQLRYADYPTIGAHVIAKETGNWYNSFLINKGERDGLKKNMTVIGAGGLVGKILSVGYNYAKVVAVIDDTSSVAAKSARTDDTGLVRGEASLMMEGLCRMEFIEPDAQILPGDEIVTSHLSSLYPPGITIGYVTEVGQTPTGLKFAIIKPTVDFQKLEMVSVINQIFEQIYPDDALENNIWKEE